MYAIAQLTMDNDLVFTCPECGTKISLNAEYFKSGSKYWSWEKDMKKEMKKITSRNTSVNSKKIPVMFTTIDKFYGWKKRTNNLDYGGGKYNTASLYLQKKGVNNYIYDPYNRDSIHNQRVIDFLAKKKIHTITLSNVLCVVKDKVDRLFILVTSHAFLVEGGTIYINIYEGDKSGKGKKTKEDCWQNNRTLKSYLPEVKKFFPNARIEHSMIVATKEEMN